MSKMISIRLPRSVIADFKLSNLRPDQMTAGIKLTPREPTEAMHAAANREWDGRMSARSAGVWQAMWDAASEQPPVNEGSVSDAEQLFNICALLKTVGLRTVLEATSEIGRLRAAQQPQQGAPDADFVAVCQRLDLDPTVDDLRSLWNFAQRAVQPQQEYVTDRVKESARLFVEHGACIGTSNPGQWANVLYDFIHALAAAPSAPAQATAVSAEPER